MWLMDYAEFARQRYSLTKQDLCKFASHFISIRCAPFIYKRYFGHKLRAMSAISVRSASVAPLVA